MVKKIALIALIAFAAALSASAETGKVFAGKQKAFQKKKISIKFISLVEDSRCPEGVDCVWAGMAKIKVMVSNKKKASKEFEVTLQGDSDKIIFEGYEIKLMELTPKPKANTRIDPKSYLATFDVRKLAK